MNRGAKFLVSTTMLAVAGCNGEQGKLEIRSTPTPLAQGQQTVPYRIAEARGQLARGNVALALEAFRLAERENPNSAAPLAGIATCYDQMGRYDLSRRNYEAALALEPGNLEVLGAFASSLQLQGRTVEALNVRREIAARSAAFAEPEQQVADVAAPISAAPEAVASAAPLMPVEVASASVTPLPIRTFEEAPVELSVSTPDSVRVALAAIETGRVEMTPDSPAAPAAATIAPAPKPVIQAAAIGQTITVKLPPSPSRQRAPMAVSLRPIAASASDLKPAPAAAQVAPAEVEAPAPLKPYARSIVEPSVVQESGPRLERVSMGEIALITVPKPVWQATTVAQTSRSTTVRFVPIREANAQPIKVRLLNAARIDRLAARTRVWLVARGWKGMSIGNAQVARTRSVILYPPRQRAMAQRLSAHFGFPIAPRSYGSQVLVLLGSDAARRKPVRTSRA